MNARASTRASREVMSGECSDKRAEEDGGGRGAARKREREREREEGNGRVRRGKREREKERERERERVRGGSAASVGIEAQYAAQRAGSRTRIVIPLSLFSSRFHPRRARSILSLPLFHSLGTHAPSCPFRDTYACECVHACVRAPCRYAQTH